jgi:NADPH-dependent 2,4-dienoyl-CoA reductase/sulfur reductase-like enzyme
MMENERAVVPIGHQMGMPQLDRADILIIGNGIAGLTAAIEARRLAPDKRIVIITEQIHPTINTPALKQFAIGKLEREQLLAYPAGTERAERIHVVNAHVAEIHANSKYIKTSNNYGFGYDKLLIATGSAPQGLPEGTPGRNFDGVCTLHRLQDYLDLRRRLSEVSDAVVIGGGVHAIETVMGLLYWGIRVHWLIRGATFMSRVLDETASEIVLEHVRNNGCRVYTNTEVVGVVGRIGAVAGVITNHKEMIPCQLVLTCTGTNPVMTLADHCTLPLKKERGIIVDDQLRTSVPDIFAAGDVAALKNPLTGKYEPRALWYAAVAQARVAAASMTGHDDLANQSFGVQWHATHLGELSMLTVGSPLETGPNIMTLTDTSQGGYRRMAIIDDRLIGYLALGSAQPDSLAIKQIIDEGHPIRDITKELLKGSFDARRYLSQRHTYMAQAMLTGKLPRLPMGKPTGKLPAPALPAPMTTSARTSQVRSQPLPAVSMPTENRFGVSAPMPAQPAASMPMQAQRDTDALNPWRVERRTDTLMANPAISLSQGPTRQTDAIDRMQTQIPLAPVPIPASSLLEEDEEISPFTGSLPALPRQVVESTLEPVPVYRVAAQSAPAASGRNLWSYSGKQAVVRREHQTRQEENQVEKVERHPSRNLWSYARKA